MPKPHQIRLAPIVIGIIGFIVILTTFGLGGCNDTFDRPQKVCLRYGAPYIGVRGRTYQDCLEYGIICLQPLVLDTSENKLICRLRQPSGQG